MDCHQPAARPSGPVVSLKAGPLPMTMIAAGHGAQFAGSSEQTIEQAQSRYRCGSRADRRRDIRHLAANFDGAAASRIGRTGAVGDRDRVSRPDIDLRGWPSVVCGRLHGALDQTGDPFPRAAQEGKGVFATVNSVCEAGFLPLTAPRCAKHCCGHAAVAWPGSSGKPALGHLSGSEIGRHPDPARGVVLIYCPMGA